jgi:hypothetical protein
LLSGFNRISGLGPPYPAGHERLAKEYQSVDQEERRRAAEGGMRRKIKGALLLIVGIGVSLLFWIGILAPLLRPE